ncbi:MAG: sulfite exporter TauE/SafE family protein [Saprospiraceae bacterium]|nr:sulfite exporter TauE/SafE family protein [Saprospiraceae bacterium]MDW8228878.1 sulfite exporter TauE/SafE family protein [Saprospiraceae bacterium]
MTLLVWTAFALGLAGSIHCAGMCGPLMLALPLAHGSRKADWWTAAAYQIGRVSVYAALGLFFGLVGKGIRVAGFQQALAIGGGALLVVGALFPLVLERGALRLPGLHRLTTWVQQRISALLQRNSLFATAAIGALNGLLPCGLVYAALAGAISTAEGWQGAVFMAAFGAGTTPLLFLLMGGRSTLSPAWRLRLRRLQPIALAAVGLWLIWRGLHLDLSLFDSAVPKARLECH